MPPCDRYLYVGGALLGHGCDTGDPIPTQGYRTIVRAERNYEEKRWVAYDRQFRCEALKAWIGRSPILAFPRRLSRAERELSPGARSTYKMIVRPPSAHATRRGRSSGGCRRSRAGRNCLRLRAPPLHAPSPASQLPRKLAAATTVILFSRRKALASLCEIDL